MARVAISVGLLAGLVGCGMPAMTPHAIEDPTPLARCQIKKSAASPLVTEWPASEKAHLESLLQSQAVVVAYEGCDLRILEGCRPEGQYAFQRTTLASDTIEITDAGDLYAKLPLGAASLEAELSASGRLAIRTTAVGQVRLIEDVSVPRTSACEGATHVVRAISVGAYDMIAGGDVRGGAGVSAGPIAAGARRRVEQRQLRSGGDPQQCSQTADEPHRDCRSPLQLFLTPVVWGASPSPVMSPEPVATADQPKPQTSPAPPPDARMSPELAGRLLEQHGVREHLQQATRTIAEPAACEGLDVEVLAVTSAHPRPLHLPKGGSRVRLKLVNTSAEALVLPSSDALHLVDRDGRAYTPKLLPDAGLWGMSTAVPAQASLQLDVIVDPGLTEDAVSVVQIGDIQRGRSLLSRCELRVAFDAADP